MGQDDNRPVLQLWAKSPLVGATEAVAVDQPAQHQAFLLALRVTLAQISTSPLFLRWYDFYVSGVKMDIL